MTATIEETSTVTTKGRDPALASFLSLIEKDIAAGHNVRDLPAGIATAMRRAAKQTGIDLDETLEGDVAL